VNVSDVPIPVSWFSPKPPFNQIRGLLAEYGLAIPQGISPIAKRLPEILKDGENGLPGIFRQLIDRLGMHLKELDRQVDEQEAQIQIWHRESTASRKLAAIPGIGPIAASTMVASVGDAKNFENGRKLAAWLGLVPRQHSSGGKQTLLGISKRGDSYLRTLLIHGARAVNHVSEHKTNQGRGWQADVIGRRNKNVAAVALANKNARTIWALLAYERNYESNYGITA